MSRITLWDLLTIMPASAALAGALFAAKQARIQGVYLLVAVLLGLVVGFLCVWVVRRPGTQVVEHLFPRGGHDGRSGAGRVPILALYVAALLWIFATGSISYYAAKGLLSFLFPNAQAGTYL